MRRPALVLALVLAVGLLPACSDDDDPEAEATSESEAEPEASASERTEESEADSSEGTEDEGVEPAAYAADVCGALSGWVDDLSASSTDLQGSTSGAADPAALKDVLVTFLEGATTRTDELVAEVEEAGYPSGDDGEALAEEFSTALSEVRDLFEGSRAEAAALPEDDPQALADGATAIGEDLTASSQRISASFTTIGERYADSDAVAAFDEEPSCRGLSETSPGTTDTTS